MTEKRFRLGYVCGDFGLIDNGKWIDLHSMSENSEKNVQICINKMNDLAEENERLKEYNNKLMKQPLLFDVQTIPNTMEIMEANTQLEEENEQLKKALVELREIGDYQEGRIKELSDENEQLKHQNELLSDELEQCKAVINKKWSEYLKKKELDV